MPLFQQIQFMAENAVAKGDALNVFEFWFNRYQTFIGGALALLAAFLTVRAMGRQTEVGRCDDAARTLTRYGIALLETMQKYEEARPPTEHEAMAVAEQRLRDFQRVAEDATLRSAMADSLMGKDQPMIAFFINSARFAANGKVYGHREQQHENMVWPLYVALTDSIRQRKTKLLNDGRISGLYNMGTVDQIEVGRAFVEQRMPVLT